MNAIFQIGATGLHAQQGALEVVAGNITNMNTPGYKRAQARFIDILATPAANETGGGGAAMMMEAIDHVFAQGELRPTGRPLDVAIDGDGFIELMGPDGQIQLWRGGSLKINVDGFLAASNGMQLKAMISIPDGATEMAISRDGVVSAKLPGENDPRELGRLDLVRVRDTDQLQSLGGGLYALPADGRGLASVTPGDEGSGVVVQGALEGSNVLLTDEMVTLMMMQRAYAASAQVVQAGDQLMSIANNLRRA